MKSGGILFKKVFKMFCLGGDKIVLERGSFFLFCFGYLTQGESWFAYLLFDLVCLFCVLSRIDKGGVFLGSKTLGLNVLELHFVMLANYDQNVQSCFRLAQSMFMLFSHQCCLLLKSYIDTNLWVFLIYLLGSKTLGLNVFEFHFLMLANHDQNIQSCFRLAQSMFMCKVRIKCTAGFIV